MDATTYKRIIHFQNNNMKNLILISLCTFILFSCSKSTDYNPRTLKGKYTISSMTLSRTYSHCSPEFGNDGIKETQNNMGKIVFTGDKTVQAATNSLSNETYIGYFDFDKTVTSGNGNTISFDKDNLFEYGFLETSAGDIITIYFNRTRYLLELTFDDKNNITNLIMEGDLYCGKEFFDFAVK